MNNEQKSKSMKKNNLKWILLNMMMAGLVMSSCSENEDIIPDKGQENEAKTSYVVAATVDGTSYLLAASSLDEGRISARGNGSEVLGASYWVFKNQKYLFGLVYNKGGNGTGASYYLTASGSIKEKYTYEYNRITTYGNWGDYVVTASTGNAATSEADNKGNLPQVLLFNYLHAEDGSQTSSSVMSENFLGNGEKVHLAGLVEANGKLYTSVIPGGMSKYGINRWPESVTDRDLISQADGGAASSSYKAGEIPSTQYPDKAFVAIYSGKSFNETPIIAETDKIGYACGRFRSQYYQTIWAADNGDISVFSVFPLWRVRQPQQQAPWLPHLSLHQYYKRQDSHHPLPSQPYTSYHSLHKVRLQSQPNQQEVLSQVLFFLFLLGKQPVHSHSLSCLSSFHRPLRHRVAGGNSLPKYANSDKAGDGCRFPQG